MKVADEHEIRRVSVYIGVIEGWENEKMRE
jgi:hypothetical protein